MRNHRHLKHRGTCICLLLFLLLIFLFGCSPSAKKNKEIVADLQEKLFSPDDVNVRITDYEIIKRQTDTNSKTDVIYINITSESNLILWNRSYVMTYGLYNEGWILDEVNGYDESNWVFQPVQGVSEDIINGYIDTYKEENMFDSIEVVDRVTTLKENWGDDFVVFQAAKEHLYATKILKYSQTWVFDENTCDFYVMSEPSQIDRTILLKEDIVGAEWNNFPRYYNTQSLFADQFDVKVESLSIDSGLELKFTKKDVWGAFWDRLDSPPEVSTTIWCPYFTYFSYEGTEEVGVSLLYLMGELYSPWEHDDNDFDTDDYFIFDFNIPGNAKIKSIPANKREHSVIKTAVTGRTMQESAREYVISRMKSDGIVSYNPENPICGLWEGYRSNGDYGEEGIVYICQDGTFFYIRFYSIRSPILRN